MTWDFLQRYDDSWIWRRINRYEVTESTRNFAALEECMQDAERHGYVSSTVGSNRRGRAPVKSGEHKVSRS